MQPPGQGTGDQTKLGSGTGVFSGTMLAVVAVCRGVHALVLGAPGGLALGCVRGIGAGVLATVVLTAGIVVMRPHRAAACAVQRAGRPSS